MRRTIRIGDQVISGMVCELCPQRPVIWPRAAFAAHLTRHNHADKPTAGLDMIEPDIRYRKGRISGVRNRHHMNGTGVIKRQAIRFAR